MRQHVDVPLQKREDVQLSAVKTCIFLTSRKKFELKVGKYAYSCLVPDRHGENFQDPDPKQKSPRATRIILKALSSEMDPADEIYMACWQLGFNCQLTAVRGVAES